MAQFPRGDEREGLGRPEQTELSAAAALDPISATYWAVILQTGGRETPQTMAPWSMTRAIRPRSQPDALIGITFKKTTHTPFTFACFQYSLQDIILL